MKRYLSYLTSTFTSFIHDIHSFLQNIDIRTTYKHLPTYSVNVMTKIIKELFRMGCHGGERSGCITDIIRRIVKAQHEAVDDVSRGCDTSCEQSIEDLLSTRPERRPSRFTTIPFMLYCKESCKPFVGSGFVTRNRSGSNRGHFECLESPIFKVTNFVRGSDSCVRLELLLPVSHRRDGDGHKGHHEEHHQHGPQGTFCDQFGRRRIDNFRETGLCITVDLNCFCGITCLDPITPEPR